MEIYNYKTPPLLFVTIKRVGDIPEHLTLVGETKEDCLNILQGFIRKQHLDIFSEGKRTTVEIRDYIDGKNGKMVSFNFKGLSPMAVWTIFTEEIKK